MNKSKCEMKKKSQLEFFLALIEFQIILFMNNLVFIWYATRFNFDNNTSLNKFKGWYINVITIDESI